MKLFRNPLFLLLATMLMAWRVYDGCQAPAPLPATVKDDIFSAARAQPLLQAFYANSQPHVSGSAQNALLRDQIVSTFEGFGYEPEVQSLFHCNAKFGECSPVENILAVRQGRQPGSAILLTAHYDSAWAGPGVADDGAGVSAVLEIARMVSLAPGFEHDVIFLLTDGEEQGLIGADAFAVHHPLFRSVRAVINLEARGASGASVMFETGDNNRGIIRMLANSLDRPVANSLAYEVYRRMPNDTDFSVYRVGGLPGVNFAFTGGASIYHSRIDDLAHLDLGSLQHHGQNAWSMLRALDARNLERLPSAEDAVYVDLFGRELLQYPVSSAIGLAVVLSVMALVAIRRAFRESVQFTQVLWSLLGVVLLTALMLAFAWLLSWPLGRWLDIHPLDHPFPLLGRSTLLLAALWSIFTTLKFLASRVTTGSLMAACWCMFVLLALLLASLMPAAGFLAILPLLGFTFGLVPDGFRWKKQPRLLIASLGGFLAAAYVGFYLFFQLDVVLNFGQSMLKIVPLLLPSIAVLPLLRRYVEERKHGPWLDHGLLVLVLAGCVGQQFVPAYTPDAPRDMALMIRQDQAHQKAWLVLESLLGSPDPVFARKHGFELARVAGVDGGLDSVLAKNVEPLDLPAIGIRSRFTGNAGGEGAGQLQVIDLQIPAGVLQLYFSLPENFAPKTARVGKLLAFDASRQSGKRGRHWRLAINHPQPGPLRVEFQFDSRAMAEELLLTARYDLPPEILGPYMADWPEDAQPAFQGPRVLQIARIKPGAD